MKPNEALYFFKLSKIQFEKTSQNTINCIRSNTDTFLPEIAETWIAVNELDVKFIEEMLNDYIKNKKSDSILDNFDFLGKLILEYMSNLLYTIHEIDYLVKNQDKIQCWLYPPESLSKNLILDDVIKITASSFHKEPLMEFNFKE